MPADRVDERGKRKPNPRKTTRLHKASPPYLLTEAGSGTHPDRQRRPPTITSAIHRLYIRRFLFVAMLSPMMPMNAPGSTRQEPNSSQPSGRRHQLEVQTISILKETTNQIPESSPRSESATRAPNGDQTACPAESDPWVLRRTALPPFPCRWR